MRGILRLGALKVCIRISFECSFFKKNVSGLGKKEQGMGVLRKLHPVLSQIATHGVLKIVGPLPEMRNSSTPILRGIYPV